MSDTPIHLATQGPPRTVLPQEDTVVRRALTDALASPGPQRRDLVAAVAAAHPRSLLAWRALGDAGRDTIERYMAYRVGYHRGLDTLRANGWRGSGYVRWSDETNHGFLGCLHGLGLMAAAIGETDEASRVGMFLAQLDPTGRPTSR